MIKKFCVSGILFFLPVLVSASVASDFIVNSQSTYDVPPGTSDLLIFDLTLPSTGLTSIKINNAGTVAQYNLTQLAIFEDGPSAGWDGDETERARKITSPFFDIEIPGVFSQQRIFVTVNVTSTYSGKTIKPEIEINSAVFSNPAFNGPTDKKITGLERIILAGTEIPYVPVSPMAKSGEALSTSTIRWHFTDLSSNEFGFKILDNNLNIAATGGANIPYLDETGLQPNTEYSGRQVRAFNDRGQSSVSTLTVFPAVQTLALPAVETLVVAETPEKQTPEVEEEAETPKDIQTQIQELQQKIIELLKQLIQLLQEQASKAQASLFGAFELFTDWLGSRF